jgi:hypothetical protein
VNSVAQSPVLIGYATPYSALQDKTLSCLTQVISHLEYASLLRQRGFATGDDARDGPDPDSTPTAFLDAVRTQAMDELHEAAKEYGIVLKEVAVLDRNFKGQIAQTSELAFFASLLLLCSLPSLSKRRKFKMTNSSARQWTPSPLVRFKLKSRLPTLTERTRTVSR